jgi:para-nitrobenzyl esterase
MRHLIFMLALVFSVGFAKAQSALIKVNEGLLQGAFENGLTIYKGVPFAAPPVGELRWRAPQPAAKWDGVREANKFAPEPMQGGTLFQEKAKIACT